MVRFQLIRMSSYAKIQLQMCWVTQRQCRSRQMWKIFTNSPSKLTFYLLQKMTCLDWTIHSWLAFNSLVCPLMLRTNNRCVESLKISVMSPNVENIHKFTQYTQFLSITKKMTCLDWTIHSWLAFNSLVCPLMLRTNNRCVESLNISVMSPNVENIHKFTQYTDYLSITKKKLSWLNNLFMVMFQFIRMSSYAKNKLQMCWVIQHQCRSRQMWKIFTNSPSTLTFCLLQKWLVLPEQSTHGKLSTHKDVLLC